MELKTQGGPNAALFRKIRIIANPVSGMNNQSEQIIRTAMDAYEGVDWELHLTQGEGDAQAAAQAAHRAGCDLVIAAGGDGTVREVAEGLLDTPVTLSILPLGTANVLSVDLGFPRETGYIMDALLAGRYQARTMDAVRIDNRVMLLRAGIGYEAEITAGTPRAEKARLGRLAYFAHAWRRLRQLRPIRYHLTIDDDEFVRYGVTCLICNSTNVGIPDVSLIAEASIDDGLLDVILVETMHLPRVLHGMWQLMFARGQAGSITHWQGHRVTVQTQSPQRMAVDGDHHKRGKRTTAVVLPHALKIAVPN